jgi:hypothetical protein
MPAVFNNKWVMLLFGVFLGLFVIPRASAKLGV